MSIKSGRVLQRCGRIKRRVRWDEDNLSENEANKHVREKITEPKTPYPYHPMTKEDGSSSPSLEPANCYDYAAHAEALRNALHKAAPNGQKSRVVRGWTTSADKAKFKAWAIEKNEAFAAFLRETDEKGFREKRSNHYDEFKKIKELQEKLGRPLYDDSSSTRGAGVREMRAHNDEFKKVKELQQKGQDDTIYDSSSTHGAAAREIYIDD